MISLIVPCYNEEQSLPIFFKAISQVADKLKSEYDQDVEFVFIDDGSKDQTLQQIRQFHELDSRVVYISFSRNFGKEAGIYAGLKEAKGDYVAIMDSDMQDPPELLPKMFASLNSDEDFDCVATRRVTRKGEPPIRSFFARRFYKLMHKISQTEIVDGARDFRLMTRRMVDAVLSVKEYNRFSKGIFGWVGFNTKWIEYENVKRVAGETKWSFWKLLLYSLDGITAFSTAPLQISSISGLLFCCIAVVMAIIYFLKTIIWGDIVQGFPTLICIILLVGGVQLFCIGILGQYLAKTYLESKRRPHYIVRESIKKLYIKK